jgi:aminoglycoside 6-adenylyltransferase
VTQTSTSVVELLNRFVLWAEGQTDIRAVIVIGSRARTEQPGDAWSDVDLIISAYNPQPYLDYSEWLKSIGSVWVSHIEPTLAPGVSERRVLFEGGFDFDLIFVQDNQLNRLLQNQEVAGIIRRGIRILVDKDRLMSRITLPIGLRTPYVPPTESQFTNLVNDFWYHAVWTAKKIRRGELYTALMSSDGHMKHLLMQMLEWHTHAVSPVNPDTWFSGRFVEQWADPRLLALMTESFAYYEQADIERGLLATMNVFRQAATETAAQLTYPYPFQADANITMWVEAVLENGD